MRKTIKQQIPDGWISSQCHGNITLRFTSIPHKTIVTDWLWRNRYAEPIRTTIIPESFREQDLMFANYYSRLNIRY